MAITLSANYSKKLGLPAYSSHSFSASVEVELTDLTQVQAECQKLYTLLQQAVDNEIQHVGFVPDPCTYGVTDGRASFGKASPNGDHRTRPSASSPGQAHSGNTGGGGGWQCTEGQRGFILRLVSDHQLEKQHTEDLSIRLFGVGVKHLNKMQASQLIDELLAQVGKPRQNRWHPPQSNGHARAA